LPGHLEENECSSFLLKPNLLAIFHAQLLILELATRELPRSHVGRSRAACPGGTAIPLGK
jgi:hypothetical protein